MVAWPRYAPCVAGLHFGLEPGWVPGDKATHESHRCADLADGRFASGLGLANEHGRAGARARAIEADWFRQDEVRDGQRITWLDTLGQRAGHFNPEQDKELQQLRHPLAGLMN